MKIFEEQFEYYTLESGCPLRADFEKTEYESEEYKKLLINDELYRLALQKMGESGWELVTAWDNPSKNFPWGKKLVFKRSSRSSVFKMEPVINLAELSEVAKKNVANR